MDLAPLKIRYTEQDLIHFGNQLINRVRFEVANDFGIRLEDAQANDNDVKVYNTRRSEAAKIATEVVKDAVEKYNPFSKDERKKVRDIITEPSNQNCVKAMRAERKYTEEELVAFGNQLLSPDRHVENEASIHAVTDADVADFKEVEEIKLNDDDLREKRLVFYRLQCLAAKGKNERRYWNALIKLTSI